MSILPEVGKNSVEYRTSRGVNFDSKRPKMVIFWLEILISRRTSMLIEQNTCNWSQMEDIQLWISKNSKNEMRAPWGATQGHQNLKYLQN